MKNVEEIRVGYETAYIMVVLFQILHTDHSSYQTTIKKERKYSHPLRMSF